MTDTSEGERRLSTAFRSRATAEYRMIRGARLIQQRMMPIRKTLDTLVNELQLSSIQRGDHSFLQFQSIEELYDKYEREVRRHDITEQHTRNVDFLWRQAGHKLLFYLTPFDTMAAKAIQILEMPFTLDLSEGTTGLTRLKREVLNQPFISYINLRTNYLRYRTAMVTRGPIDVGIQEEIHTDVATEMLLALEKCADHWESGTTPVGEDHELNMSTSIQASLKSWNHWPALPNEQEPQRADRIKLEWKQAAAAPVLFLEDKATIRDKLQHAISMTLYYRAQTLLPALRELALTSFSRDPNTWGIS